MEAVNKAAPSFREINLTDLERGAAREEFASVRRVDRRNEHCSRRMETLMKINL